MSPFYFGGGALSLKVVMSIMTLRATLIMPGRTPVLAMCSKVFRRTIGRKRTWAGCI